MYDVNGNLIDEKIEEKNATEKITNSYFFEHQNIKSVRLADVTFIEYKTQWVYGLVTGLVCGALLAFLIVRLIIIRKDKSNAVK